MEETSLLLSKGKCSESINVCSPIYLMPLCIPWVITPFTLLSQEKYKTKMSPITHIFRTNSSVFSAVLGMKTTWALWPLLQTLIWNVCNTLWIMMHILVVIKDTIERHLVTYCEHPLGITSADINHVGYQKWEIWKLNS